MLTLGFVVDLVMVYLFWVYFNTNNYMYIISLSKETCNKALFLYSMRLFVTNVYFPKLM